MALIVIVVFEVFVGNGRIKKKSWDKIWREKVKKIWDKIFKEKGKILFRNR